MAYRVNGQLLAQKISATVKVVGRVGNAHERGYVLDLGDGTQVNIIGSGQQVGQIVEVTGQVNSDLSVQEYQSAIFSNNFDLTGYSKIVELANTRFTNLFHS